MNHCCQKNIIRLLGCLLTIYCSLLTTLATAQYKKYNAIYSGVPWFDNDNKVVSAHASCIVKEDGRYYLFGEKHSDTSNAFAGFTCYSSSDLYNWTFETMALPVQPSGKLGPNRVGERAKVLKCPSTGEFVMYMHVDTLNYKDQFVGYATASNITGPYTYQGPLLFNGSPVRKWDLGAYQDADGAGYVLIHGGEICRLSSDYKSIVEQTNKNMVAGFEAPSIFKKDSLYYFLGSHLSSWEKNENYYFTASSLNGPWTNRGLFCPTGSLTWYSQSVFVLPVMGSKDTSFMFMGDRWSYPKQASAATYIWQPLQVAGTALSIPAFQEAWTINTSTGVATTYSIAGKTIANNNQKAIAYKGNWKQDTLSHRTTNEQGASFTISFKGSQVALYGLVRPDGGYAVLSLRNSKGKEVINSIIDTYCLYPSTGLRFISPNLPVDKYTLTVTVLGEKGYWSDKKKNNYGSTGYNISFDKIIVR